MAWLPYNTYEQVSHSISRAAWHVSSVERVSIFNSLTQGIHTKLPVSGLKTGRGWMRSMTAAYFDKKTVAC